jgi:hypothetical protein
LRNCAFWQKRENAILALANVLLFVGSPAGLLVIAVGIAVGRYLYPEVELEAKSVEALLPPEQPVSPPPAPQTAEVEQPVPPRVLTTPSILDHYRPIGRRALL